MKEITSYKCIKAYPGIKLGEIKLTDIPNNYAEYPEFWEPQYEPEFKIGDFVVCIGESNECHRGISSGWKKDLIYKITPTNTNDICKFGGVHGNGVYIESLRLATEEEIKVFQTITIGGYTAKKEGSLIAFGCARFSKEMLTQLLVISKTATSSGFDLNISKSGEIKVIDKVVTNQQIQSLIDKLKNEDDDLPF